VVLLQVIMATVHRYSRENDEKAMTRQEVRDIDAWAINTIGIPGVVLMENAGRSCAELIIEELRAVRSPKAAIFCGTGNNGGDGYVIARHLVNSGCDVRVFICGSREKIKGDAKINLAVLIKMGLVPVDLVMTADGLEEQVGRLAGDCDIVVDAILGTGLSESLGPQYISLISAVNAIEAKRLAVDIPSGLDCDTGKPMPVAVMADMTVTFVAAKKGFASATAARYTGVVYVASIGIEVK
jgi:NAD(P)H-hydrate epimerase